MRATERSVAISGFWHEIASSKLIVSPRNDETTTYLKHHK
ncbi:hypothetical protein RFEPED_1553 [Rickettsia felis str. Pedreira]|uniref:Uncharacterized protein n=1 Tax=Rickettsia felis str. Pedreira TaxID=1359196 RepID=A0A0F3MUP5_RICFI|nr:hypothetical protein RFEPED_1553 [Rickettsia felis str. Pedreira]